MNFTLHCTDTAVPKAEWGTAPREQASRGSQQHVQRFSSTSPCTSLFKRSQLRLPPHPNPCPTVTDLVKIHYKLNPPTASWRLTQGCPSPLTPLWQFKRIEAKTYTARWREERKGGWICTGLRLIFKDLAKLASGRGSHSWGRTFPCNSMFSQLKISTAIKDLSAYLQNRAPFDRF